MREAVAYTNTSRGERKKSQHALMRCGLCASSRIVHRDRRLSTSFMEIPGAAAAGVLSARDRGGTACVCFAA